MDYLWCTWPIPPTVLGSRRARLTSRCRSGTCIFTLLGHQHMVNCVAFSPNGLFLASATNNEPVKIWDANTGHAAWESQSQTMTETTSMAKPHGSFNHRHSPRRRASRFLQTARGQAVEVFGSGLRHGGPAVCGNDTIIGLVRVSVKPISRVAFLPDGTRVYSTTDDGTTCVPVVQQVPQSTVSYASCNGTDSDWNL